MKLDYKRTIYIGMAFLGISAFWQLYDVIIPLILENQFALDKTWTGLVMSLDNTLSLLAIQVLVGKSDQPGYTAVLLAVVGSLGSSEACVLYL
ncbi:TPA: hypothetical protein ACGO5P_002069 [Streptococcus suis]